MAFDRPSANGSLMVATTVCASPPLPALPNCTSWHSIIHCCGKIRCIVGTTSYQYVMVCTLYLSNVSCDLGGLR